MKTGLEGKQLPAFSFLLMDSTTRLNTDSIKPEGPFVICYFSPQCPYCRAQIKSIIKHQKEFKNTHFFFITEFPYHDVKGFTREFKLEQYGNFTTGIDDTKKFSKYFSIPSIPYLAIYNTDKRLKSVLIGITKFKQIESEISNKSL